MRLATKETETENLFEILANKSPVGICIIQDGKFCYINPAFQSNTGYREDELLGRDSLEIVFPEDRERVRENAIKMLKGKLTLPYQFRVTHKDGSVHWVIESVASVRYRERQATLGSFVDITERKQAEEALRASEEMHKTVVEDAPIGIYYSDFNGTFLYGNRKAEEIVGYKVEELLGKSFLKLKLLRPEGIAKAVKLLALNKLGKATGPDRFTLNRKDGTTSIVEIRTKVITVGGKKAVLGMVEDITKRKQAEEARKQAEEEKSALLEEAPVGIMHADLKGKITYINKRFEAVSGYSREEIVGENGFQLDWLPAGTMKYLAKRMAARLRGRPGKSWETQFKCKDGRWIWVDLEGKVLRKSGVPVGFQIIARNTTARKRTEEALQAEKNKLQSLIDSMEDTITIQDTEYNIIYQNEPSRIASGGDHVGEKCYRAYEGREGICEDCPVEKAFKDSKSHTAERRTAILGKVAFWENTANPIRDAEGRVISCLELARDVTERKRAEEALQAERNKLKSLIDAVEYIITIRDTEYNILYENEPARMVFGGDHLGEKCYRVYEHREKVCDGCPVDEALKDGKSHTTERRLVTPSGEVIFLEITANPIRDGGGRIISCLEVSRNVTERKQAEEQLQESEQYLKTLFNASAGGILVIDPKTHDIVDANSTVSKMIGIERDHIIGRMCHKFVCSAEVGKCPITDLGQKVDSSERILLKANGESMPIIKSVVPITRHGRQYLLELIVDITERKRQEQALADEATRRRILVDQSLDGIVVLDVDARVYEANQRFADMLGYTLEEVRELHTWDWDKKFPPEKILEMGRNVDEKGFHLETQHTRKDGSVIDVDISINAAMFGGQKLIFCVCRDVTERKKMEEALKLAAEEWRRTFDSISDAVCINSKDFRLLRANKAFADMYHVEPSQVIGKRCYEVTGERKEPVEGCPHQETLRTEKPAKSEFFIHEKGTYVEISTSPIFDKKGEVVGTVHITRDITERKQQNERLMMADRLASIGELAAGTAHELNNPLTSVIGFSQLLMEKDIRDDIREDVKFIYDEAQRAANVTKNLLTFARKHTTVEHLNQINNIIEDVLQLRAYEHKVNNIEVKRQLAPDLPEIMVDDFQMQQVFLNIIINAEYFMTEAHNRGTLTITTKKQNGTVRISFADDGPGIPPENLNRIFDPFFTTREAGQGTGLGLSICHGIVAEHGGQIYATSQLGKGATIFVELPIKSP
jgi:PAS domain S-box-containing protein